MNKFFSFFKRNKYFKASNLNVITKSKKYYVKSYIFNNNLIKEMNAINPQSAGRFIEDIVYWLITLTTPTYYQNEWCKPNNMLLYVLNNIVPKHPRMKDLCNIKYTELTNLLSYLNFIVKECINPNKEYISVYHNEDLSFKVSKCCRVNNYNCISDITTDDTIIDIKVVKHNMLNQHKTELTSVGLKYYNQMMAYASGFYRKYDKWPKQLIVLNFYTCEVISWKPSRKDYLKFNKML